jgi:hypothetical protein
MQTPNRIVLTDDERAELERRARSQTLPHRTVVRARAILLLAASRPIAVVARDIGRDRKRVRLGGQRFVRKRLGGLDDLPRSGRPARFSP